MKCTTNILTEAITDSIKYAFPAGAGGNIDILMTKPGPHHILLRITDNGTGFPESTNLSATNSLGMQLMSGLSEDIHGTFNIESKNGTTITVKFTDDQH